MAWVGYSNVGGTFDIAVLGVTWFHWQKMYILLAGGGGGKWGASKCNLKWEKSPKTIFPFCCNPPGHISLFSLHDSAAEAELNLDLLLSEVCTVDQMCKWHSTHGNTLDLPFSGPLLFLWTMFYKCHCAGYTQDCFGPPTLKAIILDHIHDQGFALLRYFLGDQIMVQVHTGKRFGSPILWSSHFCFGPPTLKVNIPMFSSGPRWAAAGNLCSGMGMLCLGIM